MAMCRGMWNVTGLASGSRYQSETPSLPGARRLCCKGPERFWQGELNALLANQPRLQAGVELIDQPIDRRLHHRFGRTGPSGNQYNVLGTEIFAS